MLQGIQHFGMTTPDLQKSLTFYIDILGGRLAVGGDGFYGAEMHNLLFQMDEMRSKEGEEKNNLFHDINHETTDRLCKGRIVTVGS